MTPTRRSYIEIKFDALLRRLIYYNLGSRLPVYLISEYPKSGGSWVTQMIADLLDLPFYQQRLPRLVPQVAHGHHLFNSHLSNVFIVIRDGRDVMVSFYHHLMFLHGTNQNWVEHQVATNELKIGDPKNVRENLPAFINYVFNKNGVMKFTWTQFIESWANRDVPRMKYEDLLTNPEKTLKLALERYDLHPSDERISNVVEKYSFEKMANRKRGQEDRNSFLRKGISGDWKNVFSLEAKKIFHHYAGKKFIFLGYELNDNWVSDSPDAK